jgi:hypothetical protein
LASEIVWLDAFLLNVDRTAKNPNLLIWNRELWLIDHGAALYFHHNWSDAGGHVRNPFARIKEHVLLAQASQLRALDSDLGSNLAKVDLGELLSGIPDEWLSAEPEVGNAAALKAAYRSWLAERLQVSSLFVTEAERARANLV